MHRWTRARALTAAGALALTGLALSTPTAVAESSQNSNHPSIGETPVNDAGGSPDLNGGKHVPLDKSASRKAIAAAKSDARARRSTSRPAVGEQKTWLANDDTDGSVSSSATRCAASATTSRCGSPTTAPSRPTTAATTSGPPTSPPARSSASSPSSTTTCYPTESRVFSKPPRLNGSKSLIAGSVLGDKNYWKVGKKQSDDIVVLVDNVRDANFYDPTTPDGQTYIAGFFSSQFNDYTDRNVMTIDAFDWRHRTGANPPDDAGPASAECGLTGKPRANDYEGTFAHEYQHLLEHYRDSDEVSWVNEGLSDYAQTVTGYVNPATSPKAPDADSHIGCFEGYLAPVVRRAGELADRLGRPGRPRDPLRLRRCVLLHAVPREPLRRRLHVGVPPPEGQRPRRPRRPSRRAGQEDWPAPCCTAGSPAWRWTTRSTRTVAS